MGTLWRRFRGQNRPVQVLLVNEFVTYLSFYMLYPYLAVYLNRDLGLAVWMVGLVFGVRTFCQQGLTVIGGTLADRIGFRATIVIGLALRVVAFALFGVARSLPLVLVAAALTGLAGAFFSPALRAYLAHEATGQRAEAFALVNVFGQVGNFVGPLVGLALLGVNFAAVCYVAAALFALLVFVQLRYMPEAARDADAAAPASVWQDWREVLRNRPFLLFSLAMFGYSTLYNQLYLSLPLDGERRTGSTAVAGVLFAVSAVLTVAGQLRVTVWLRTRLAAGRSIALGFALMAVAFVPPLVAARVLPARVGDGPGPWLVGTAPALLGTVLLTLGFMFAQPFALELIAHLSRDRLVGTYYGFYSVVGSVFVTGGNIAVGAMFDAGGGVPGPAPWLLMIAVGFASAGAFLVLERRGVLPALAPAG